MSKNNRSGQAAILTGRDREKIRKAFVSEKHRILWDIAYYTGERWGAVCKLKVSDVYADPSRSEPLTHITYHGRNRKKCQGEQVTRQVPVSEELGRRLRAYRPPVAGYLFPGRGGGSPMRVDSMDDALRRACEKAGLRGVSTHSTRRTAATTLGESGVSARVIQEWGGWADLRMVSRYVEVSPKKVTAAVNLL